MCNLTTLLELLIHVLRERNKKIAALRCNINARNGHIESVELFRKKFFLNYCICQVGMPTAYCSGPTGNMMKQSNAIAMLSSGRRLVIVCSSYMCSLND